MKKPFGKTKVGGFLIKKVAPIVLKNPAVKAVLPGASILANLASDTSQSPQGEINRVQIGKDISFDLGKIFAYILILGALLGWWSFEEAEQGIELTK